MRPDKETNNEFTPDIEKIQSLGIVPSILDLICKTTGLGFAAIARVTHERWVACAVNDQIAFGLKPGGELLLETTICNEIHTHHQPVVIDDVHTDAVYQNHHTPKMYGFRSYISVPIFLKNGSFYGTLCAIDPQPAKLVQSGAVQLFTLFADLIAFHLLSVDQMRTKTNQLQYTEAKLKNSLDELRQYAHISNHTLQEPLRKLRVFADMAFNDTSLPENHHLIPLIKKIHRLATEFSLMIEQLTNFSENTSPLNNFQLVDLNAALAPAITRLTNKINLKQAVIERKPLHAIHAIPHQITLLFYFLLDNALTFAKPDVPPVINIHSVEMPDNERSSFVHLGQHDKYCKITIEDNGIGMNEKYTRQIFDLFARLNSKDSFSGLGMGLSQTQKIIRNHEGAIRVHSVVNKGTRFVVLLPFKRTLPNSP